MLTNSLLKNAFIMKGSVRFYKSSTPLKWIISAKVPVCEDNQAHPR